MLKKILALLFIFSMVSVSCLADSREVGLIWDQEISYDFAGWKIYLSNVSGQDYIAIPNVDNPGNDLTLVYDSDMTEYGTSITLQVPVGVDITYYFVVEAFDETGNPSGYSNEASQSFYITPPTTIPPTTTTTIDNEPPETPYNLEIVRIFITFKLKG